MGAFEFKILGSVEIEHKGRLVPVRGVREQSVMAMLLLEAGHVVPVARLVDAVWDADPPQAAEKAVRNTVSALRGRLAHAGASQTLIETSTAGYRLRLDHGQLDAARFADHAASARHLAATGQPGKAVSEFRAALGLWRGPALAGISGLAIEAAAARLDEQRLTAWEHCLDLELQLGRHREVTDELRVLVGEHALRERMTGQLMLALYRGGRQAEALDAYHRLAKQLADDLGVDTCAEIARLHEAILRHDSTLDPESEPQRVTPHELPPAVAGFTGRLAELAALAGLLDRPAGHSPGAVVIAAIAGTAGVGKTSLALHFAHQVSGSFPDGQLYMNLRGFDPHNRPLTPQDALSCALRGLGVDPRQIPVELHAQAALYRSVLAGRRVLVILDNAANADQVRPLLPGTDSCLVVVTSRNRLGGLVAQDGARRVTLDVLSLPEAVKLLEMTIGVKRVAAEPGSAARVAELCGRLPLALRICAEQMAARPHLTLTELGASIADERDRLDLLATDDQITAVRGTLSWSYRALDSASARLFRLLGLHPGSEISGGAAAALADLDLSLTRRLLRGLTGVHMLEEIGTDRYRLHDLLRLYAAECAGADEAPDGRDAALRRLFGWYLHSADAADSLLDPHRPRIPLGPPPEGSRPGSFAGYDEAQRWCDAERTNLVAIVRRASAAGDHATAWQLPVALFSYFNAGKSWDDWIATHQVGLESARATHDQLGEAVTRTSLALAYYDLREFDKTIDELGQALPTWRELGVLPLEGVTLDTLGAACRDTGRPQTAIDHLEQALTVWRRSGDRWGEAITLHNLGDTYLGLGRVQDAISYLELARGIRHDIGDAVGLAWTLHDLGCAHLSLGQSAGAIALLSEALQMRHDIGDKHGEARSLRRLGLAHHAIGDLAAARTFLHAALKLFEELADPRGQTVVQELEELGLAT